MSLREAVEARSLAVLLSLPPRVQRALAGRPVVIDGETLAVDTQLVLRMQRLARIPGSETLPIPEGRDAMRHANAVVRGEQPIGAVRELEVAGLPARHYLPTGLAVDPGPLLLFFHGGGYLYGDLETHDAPCRVLAERSGVPALAVDYRLGPEHPLPSAHDDAEAALRWVVDHADELGVDPARIGVGGDSAGGNLAAWTALAAARDGIPLAFQLLVYPCTVSDHDTESYRLFGDGFYLTAAFIQLVNRLYLPTPADRSDHRIVLMDAEIPDGVAPAYLCTAGFDPLRDEGEAYGRKLAEAGVQVEVKRFADQIHGFLNVVGAGRSSPAAVAEIADRLRAALK